MPNKRSMTKLKKPLMGDELAAEVERLARIGATYGEIACQVGLTTAQVRRRCKQAIAKGRNTLKLRLRSHQLDHACGEDRSERMLLWLGREYLRQGATGPTAVGKGKSAKRYINIQLEQV